MPVREEAVVETLGPRAAGYGKGSCLKEAGLTRRSGINKMK